MASIRSICPHCGRIVPARQVCPCRVEYRRQQQPSQAERLEREPWRRVYTLASYRRGRAERYRLVAGRCESCGDPLKGSLYRAGADWQCDHHVEARLFPLDRLNAANAVENLRCYCTSCHAGARKPGR